MREPKNIKEFQKLVKRYETITLDEIINVDKNTYPNGNKSKSRWLCVLKELTGYGSVLTCSLCKLGMTESVYPNGNSLSCPYCVYTQNDWSLAVCVRGTHAKTYNDIGNSETPEELLKAYRDRAAFLRETYPQYLNETK